MDPAYPVGTRKPRTEHTVVDAVADVPGLELGGGVGGGEDGVHTRDGGGEDGDNRGEDDGDRTIAG